MTRSAALRVQLSAMLLIGFAFGCDRAHPANVASPSTVSSTRVAPPTVTTVASLVPTRRGDRVFGLALAGIRSGAWVTVAFHPNRVPAEIHVTAAYPMEVCPASVDDGSIETRSWPSVSRFASCRPFDSAGRAELPSSDGLSHVAFAVRAVGTRPIGAIHVSVEYQNVDSFVEILPPPTSSRTIVTFTPTSRTVGAQSYLVPSYGPAPGASVALTQNSRALHAHAACDFGSEIDCVGGVTPALPVTATLSDPTAKRRGLALYLTWK